jgi:hypothetical protein
MRKLPRVDLDAVGADPKEARFSFSYASIFASASNALAFH